MAEFADLGFQLIIYKLQNEVSPNHCTGCTVYCLRDGMKEAFTLESELVWCTVIENLITV